MTVKELIKSNGYANLQIVLFDYEKCRYISYESYYVMRDEYKGRIVSSHGFVPGNEAPDFLPSLWIDIAPVDLKPDCVHGFRFITLAGRHDRERIVEVLEWDADHLTRDALRNCMLSLYSHASIGDWTVHGYLERIENGWYHSTVCSMSAVTLMSIWPDKVDSTEIRVNDKFIRRMGGNYAGQRTN